MVCPRTSKSTHILIISRKPVVNPRRHNHQIALLQPQPHPRIVLTPHIKVSAASQNVPNLLVLVQVLVEESFDLLLVTGEEGRRNLNLVAVLVAALGGDLVHAVQVVREEVVGYADGGEVGGVDRAAGVVGEALIAFEVVKPVGFHFGECVLGIGKVGWLFKWLSHRKGNCREWETFVEADHQHVIAWILHVRSC